MKKLDINNISKLHYNFFIPLILMVSSSLLIASFDIYLPCAPFLTDFFQTSEFVLQLSILVVPMASSVVGIAYGYWIDSKGRRLPMIIGLLIFGIGSLGCTFSNSIELFIFFRVIQSLGGGGVNIISLTILADMFKGLDYAKYLATYSLLFPITFTISPILGARLFNSFGWRSIFITIFIFTLIVIMLVYFYLPNTMKITKKTSLKVLHSNILNLCKKKHFVILSIAHSLPVGISGIFTVNSAFLYIETFGFNHIEYSYIQAIPTFFNILGSFFYRQNIKSWGLEKSLKFGKILIAVFIALCAFGLLLYKNPWVMLFSACVLNFSLSCVIATCGTMAFELSGPEEKGLSVAVVGFFRNIVLAFTSILVGVFFNGTTIPVYIGMAFFSVLNLIITNLKPRQKN